MLLLRNMAVGLVPEVLRVADGPPPEAHEFLIRGGLRSYLTAQHSTAQHSSSDIILKCIRLLVSCLLAVLQIVQCRPFTASMMNLA